MSALPRSVFNTASLPLRDRYAAWRESISVVFGYELDSSVDPERFHATIDNTLFEPFILSSFQADAALYERDAARIARDGVDMVILQFALAGPGHLRIGREQRDLAIGDVIIMDMARPVLTRHAREHNFTLSFPRRVLEDGLPGVERAHLAVLPAQAPLAVLLRSHVQTLYQQVDRLSLAEGQALVQPTVALAVSAIAAALGFAPDESKPLSWALRQRADRVIDQLLTRPELSVAQFAAAVPCSRSRLYALYKEDGGVAHYLQQRRLRHVALQLASARQRHRTVASIASAAGFGNVSSFHRSFRAEFGMTPRDLRQQSALFATVAHARATQGLADASRAYEAWVRERLRS